MATAGALPKDISKLGQEIKLFGKWDTQEFVSSSVPLVSYFLTPSQCGSQGHLLDGLHPSPARGVPTPHRRPLRKEAVQKGTNAHRRASRRQVRRRRALPRPRRSPQKAS
jgi:hypothetical protein